MRRELDAARYAFWSDYYKKYEGNGMGRKIADDRLKEFDKRFPSYSCYAEEGECTCTECQAKQSPD